MALIASLQLVAGVRKGRTYLQSSFFSQPFKVMNITEGLVEKELQLMIMNASPGVLDGDNYLIQIKVAQEGALHLYTQSYQRLYQMTTGARQQMEVHIEESAAFYFLPHPIVPHKNSIFRNVNLFFLSKSSTLIWGEILTPGRKLNGELFAYSFFSNKTEIYIDKKLIVKENLLLQPSFINSNALGQLEGYTHQASFICLNGTIDFQRTVDKNSAILSQEKDLVYGVTIIPGSGFMVRILGYKAEQIHLVLLKMTVCCKREMKKRGDEVNILNASSYVS